MISSSQVFVKYNSPARVSRAVSLSLVSLKIDTVRWGADLSVGCSHDRKPFLVTWNYNTPSLWSSSYQITKEWVYTSDDWCRELATQQASLLLLYDTTNFRCCVLATHWLPSWGEPTGSCCHLSNSSWVFFIYSLICSWTSLVRYIWYIAWYSAE